MSNYERRGSEEPMKVEVKEWKSGGREVQYELSSVKGRAVLETWSIVNLEAEGDDYLVALMVHGPIKPYWVLSRMRREEGKENWYQFVVRGRLKMEGEDVGGLTRLVEQVDKDGVLKLGPNQGGVFSWGVEFEKVDNQVGFWLHVLGKKYPAAFFGDWDGKGVLSAWLVGGWEVPTTIQIGVEMREGIIDDSLQMWVIDKPDYGFGMRGMN